MSLHLRQDSSYAHTEELQLSSKLQSKHQDDSDKEINYLMGKICEMEKNYIAMQKLYSQKIKMLYLQINDKDQQFKRLKAKVVQVKCIAEDQNKKANQLKINHEKKQALQPRIKSKSPITTTRSNKKIAVNAQIDQNKSNSPKTSNKKLSSPSKEVNKQVHKQITSQKLVKKILTGTYDSGSIQQQNSHKNITSSQKMIKKSISPSSKNSYESKKVINKLDTIDSLKMIKKPTSPMANLKQKAPVFKFK